MIKIGLVKGLEYGDIIHRHAQEHPSLIQYVYSDEAFFQNVRKLELGGIEAILADKTAFINQTREIGTFLKFRIGGFLPFSPEEMSIYIGFSPNKPKSREYTSILSDGMSELRQSGELEAILRKYRLLDWKWPA